MTALGSSVGPGFTRPRRGLVLAAALFGFCCCCGESRDESPETGGAGPIAPLDGASVVVVVAESLPAGWTPFSDRRSGAAQAATGRPDPIVFTDALAAGQGEHAFAALAAGRLPVRLTSAERRAPAAALARAFAAKGHAIGLLELGQHARLDSAALSWIDAHDERPFLLWIRADAIGHPTLAEALDGLFQGLAARGALPRTVVAVTAERGATDPEASRTAGQERERAPRVPLLVFHPAMPQGDRSSLPVSSVDLVPTAAALTGVPLAAAVDGVSLLDSVPATRLRLATGAHRGSQARVLTTRGALEVRLDCAAAELSAVEPRVPGRGAGDRLPARHPRVRALLRETTLALGDRPCPPPEPGQPAGPLDVALGEVEAELEALSARARNDRLWAEPPVLRACRREPVKTRLHWRAREAGGYVIRLGSPTGPLMARGRAVDSAETGPWVHDRTDFFLVAAASGRAVAWTRVFVRTADCEHPAGASSPSQPSPRPAGPRR